MSNSQTKKLKPSLYNDLHPNSSLKNTGFKDKKTALRTIKLISKRALRYQFDVINTMYYRAKFHPHKTNDMDDAIKIYKEWIKEYKHNKKIEDKSYPWLSLDIIKKFEKLADEYNVSKVARGLVKGTKTDEGFLKMYKKVNGNSHKLQYIPIKKNNPNGNDYYSYRISFIKARLAQIKNNNTPLYYNDGDYKGLPTKQHLILILHAYSPDKKIYKL